jgi:Zn-dependent metalloprotease
VLAALLCLAFGISGSASGSAKQSAKGIDPALAKQLRDEARGSVSISEKKATKTAGFVGAGANGDLLPSDKSGSPSGKANGFFKKYGALVGATGESQLVQKSASGDGLGGTSLRYDQLYNGVPVWGAQLVARLDAANNLTAVAGIAVPDLNLSTTPGLSTGAAGTLAIETVVNDPPTSETGAKAQLSQVELKADSKLYVYKQGLVKGDAGSAQLAYQVEVTNDSNIRDIVILSAFSGKVLNRYSAIPDALFRQLYELSPNSTPVWQEGDPFPGALNLEQQNLVNFTGDAYRMYFNAFGRDSYDGLGARMRTVNNDPGINCPNANWNGRTTNYCNGVTSDDVVAHEWSHAYTEYTHGLIYQWQPGALNEAYSDIFGETVDQLNGVQTDTPGGTRTVGACSTRTVPVPILNINSPATIAGTCAAGAAQFGPPLTATGTTGNVVLADDGVADPSTSNACTPFVNAAAISGNIALVDRGVCTFTVKVKNAQNAGATGVVVANNANVVAGMAGGDPTITIPSLMISLSNGNLIKGELSQSHVVNVTLKVKGGAAPPENKIRWLMGEDSQAFNSTAGAGNHAIRDMWDPTCLSDPGKVSDAEYQCDPSDAGGVHTNSGVINHGYALLVDGGTYNGRTVTGLGLVKAAHIYWRAESVYQVPTTNFDDHADALEQSCTDLIGQSLTGLSTSAPAGPSGQSITAADCAEVTDMIAAVELRTDPTAQCHFTPLLNGNPTNLCAGSKNAPVLYQEDFEDGLAGWTLTNQGVYSGWSGTNWAAKSSLPGGRAGTAAFAEDLDGACSGGAGDRSGVMRLLSPAITLPNSETLNSPRVTFEHYVATEFGYDGGNIKVSINGGAFVLIPASAFQFNPYNTTMQPAPGNTSPLAGQPGFSGTDGGQVHGSWGQSQIDLSRVGVKKGDTFQLRFEFGMDGCGNVDGWYVDDVKVRACNTKKEAAATVAASTVYARD